MKNDWHLKGLYTPPFSSGNVEQLGSVRLYRTVNDELYRDTVLALINQECENHPEDAVVDQAFSVSSNCKDLVNLLQAICAHTIAARKKADSGGFF